MTGATGFLGSHVLKELLNSTEDNVIVLKRTSSNVWRIKDEIKSERIKVYDTDKGGISRINFTDIDTIVHCAIEYGRTSDSCLDVLKSNLMFPIQLLEIAAQNNIRTFINTDSYFNKDNLFYSYLYNYSLSKKSLVLWLKFFSRRVNIINMMLEHIYGEYDNSDKFVESMIQRIAVNPVESIDLTLGEQKRDFVYVKDVAKLYVEAISFSRKNRNLGYKQFDIGTGKSSSIRDFCRAIQVMSNSPTELNFGRIPYRDDEIMDSYANVKGLDLLIKNYKFYSIEEGIKSIMKIYGVS